MSWDPMEKQAGSGGGRGGGVASIVWPLTTRPIRYGAQWARGGGEGGSYAPPMEQTLTQTPPRREKG